MNRCRCFAVFLSCSVLAAVTASAAARSAAALSLCTRVATRLRRSPAIVARDADTPNRWLRPWISFAQEHPVKQASAYHKILPIWHSSMGRGPAKSIEVLSDAGIMRISGPGMASCSRAMFFMWQRDAVLRVLSLPPLQPTPCLYRRQRGQLARVLGQPAYVESETLDDTKLDLLMLISPWLGSDWGRPCPVAIRFTYTARFKPGWRYCGGNQALCAAARKAAPDLEQRYHTYFLSSATVVTERTRTPQIHFGESLSAQTWALIERAERIATVRSISATHGPMPPWLRDFNLQDIDYFALQLNGKRYIGAVSPLNYGIGTLFGVYQAPGAHSKRLIPLVVFRMLWQPNGVKSIQVNAHREPQGPDNSFGIL